MFDASRRPPRDRAEDRRRLDEYLEDRLIEKRRVRHQAMREAETEEREAFEAERARRLDNMPKVDPDELEE